MRLKKRLLGSGAAVCLVAASTIALAPSATAGADRCGGDACIRVNRGGTYVQTIDLWSNRMLTRYSGHYELYGSATGDTQEVLIGDWKIGGAVLHRNVYKNVPTGNLCVRVWEHLRNSNGYVVKYKLRGDTCIGIHP